MGADHGNPGALPGSRKGVRMRRLRALLVRLGGLFNKDRRERDLAAELESHLRLHVEENLRAGMSPAEARRQALIKLGGLEQTKEIYRERRGLPLLDTLFQDVRFAVRMLRKNPGFTAVAIVTLALAIAVNSTIFSMVNGWMLRPPTIKDPGRVVMILSTDPAKGGYGWDQNPVSVPDFVAWREQSHSFEDMVASHGSDFALTGGTEPEWCDGARVSANYFQ